MDVCWSSVRRGQSYPLRLRNNHWAIMLFNNWCHSSWSFMPEMHAFRTYLAMLCIWRVNSLRYICDYMPVSFEVWRISLYNFARRFKRHCSYYIGKSAKVKKEFTLQTKTSSSVKKLFSTFRQVLAKWVTQFNLGNLKMFRQSAIIGSLYHVAWYLKKSYNYNSYKLQQRQLCDLLRS